MVTAKSTKAELLDAYKQLSAYKKTQQEQQAVLVGLLVLTIAWNLLQ
jgi:hypothetical protein